MDFWSLVLISPKIFDKYLSVYVLGLMLGVWFTRSSLDAQMLLINSASIEASKFSRKTLKNITRFIKIVKMAAFRALPDNPVCKWQLCRPNPVKHMFLFG